MKNLSFLLFLFFITANTYAHIKIPLESLKSEITPPLNMYSKDYNFEGIVKLSNCSGAIIKFKGQSVDSNAVVLTNGHCLRGSFLKNNEFIHKKRVSRSMKVADGNMKFHKVKAIEIMYGTMTGTDSAFYKLRETYRDLEALSIMPFELSDTRPEAGTEINIISGYWERGYSCEIDKFIFRLKEGPWLFNDSIRFTDTGCKTIGGTSGSPIIMHNTRTVIGVNNTANESGRKCTVNNPCEIDEEEKVSVLRGISYGQQTYQFYSCLDADYNIDLNRESCNITK